MKRIRLYFIYKINLDYYLFCLSFWLLDEKSKMIEKEKRVRLKSLAECILGLSGLEDASIKENTQAVKRALDRLT